MVSKIINIGLRAWELFCTVIVMALVGNMIASASSGNPSIVNYDMFVVVFAILSLIYLFASAFNEGFTIHPILPVTLDLLNVLFWFCGAVATAAKLGVHSCSNSGYTNRNSITNGEPGNTGGRCREAQAATAFLFFGWAAFVASLFFSFLGARSGGVNLRSGGIRKGGPAMSQV